MNYLIVYFFILSNLSAIIPAGVEVEYKSIETKEMFKRWSIDSSLTPLSKTYSLKTEKLKTDIINTLRNKYKFSIDLNEKELGKGNYGIVFKGINLNGKRKVVIKITTATETKRYFNVIKNSTCFYSSPFKPPCNDLRQVIPYEVAALIRSKNIDGVIEVYGIGRVIINGSLAFHIIIMQFVEGSMTGEKFSNCIRRQKIAQSLNEQHVYDYFKSMLQQLYEVNKKLYDAQVYHNDIKSDNIILTYNSSFKHNNRRVSDSCDTIGVNGKIKVYLIDFGNAVMKSNSRHDFLFLPTAGADVFNLNRAPEFFNLKNYGVRVKKLLVWYHGTFLFELLSGRHLFNCTLIRPPIHFNQGIIDQCSKDAHSIIKRQIGKQKLFKNVLNAFHGTLRNEPGERMDFSNLGSLL